MDAQDARSTRPRWVKKQLIPDRSGGRGHLSGPDGLTIGVDGRSPSRGFVSVLLALVVQLRPTQWVKNFACLAGLIFSGQLFQPRAIGLALVGFLAYCLASSSIYILNDYFDREKDRLNPRTARRPLASGALPVWVAALAFLGLVAGSCSLALSLGTPCSIVIATYLLMNVFYTLRLKEIVIADVMTIALGFVLRVMMGVYAVGVRPTPWIVLCMFFLALFLGFAKRKSELVGSKGGSSRIRPVLAKYEVDYLDILLTMTATMAILCYTTFTVASRKNPSLVVTIVPVVYCVFRYLLHVQIHGQGGSPEKLLFRDRRLLLGICVWLICYVTIDYNNINIFEN